MSDEFDELLSEEVLTERGQAASAASADASREVQKGAARDLAGLNPAPVGPRSVSTTPEDPVPPDKVSRGGAQPSGAARAGATEFLPGTPVRVVPDPKPAKREKRKVVTASGKCSMYAPRGTRCPVCGHVHPL